MISIICPNYNNTRNVIKNIELLDSSGVEYQLIIVDDGSHDYSLLHKFSSSRILVLQNRSANSAGKCRNIGLNYIRFPWTIFLDADDTIDIFQLKNIICERNVYTEGIPDIIFTPPMSKKIDGSVSKRHRPYSKLVNDYFKYGAEDLRYWYHVPWGKIYYSDFLKESKIKFSECIVSNDVEFSLHTGMSAKKVLVSDICYYCVIESSSSLTKQISSSNLRLRRDVLIRYNTILIDNSLNKYIIPLCKLDFRLLVNGSFNSFLLKDIFIRSFYPSFYYLKSKLRK
ncbi:glycosyltransferase family 2 protein [Vibrio breoganii]|uniref:glycosyltransferase family 2 protein n=1 Tax=Vibrio breoganii TaxID=553239 RepID=UPI000CC623C0|nr:hypothetical protein BCT64_18330 [Vibrio breoganii]PMN70146.1 hypothetical protein BCT28_18035 [Vibrio breoganii]